MRKYGLIGYPLTHSFSPAYFAEKFADLGIKDARYDLYPLEDIEEFTSLPGDICGLNVTIPYKEMILPFLDEISVEARAIGAVNTIRFVDGKKLGHNTDIYGFKTSLMNALDHEKPQKALVLGTGGAAKAVKYVLVNMGISVAMVSRTRGDINYKEVDKLMLSTHTLIVNTTPLGMYPYIDSCPPIPYEYLTEKHILFDLVYNPEKTLFLIQGLSRNAKVVNGLEMLRLQADRAWEIWNQ